ncbi:hypothetical protein A9267_05915 [Shewanella sp. UCD-FRSSP16_17]|uniref:hypothetical protein n=1 Tax=Shewanella sp. UCD-FRSSP16_17 TaxID=1853256 RepID=UPI0007EEA4CA|nr:hypothetical protein [Shewanella sp. UCD-FRSSP16_17]OBT10413.1 hypothetical protein A9267_05915 [Shewanella sp. UCD-FRSSP16_17]
MNKYVKISLNIVVLIFLGWNFYGYYENKQSNNDLRNSFESYFTDSDKRIEMTWFKVDKNTIGIALNLNGIGLSSDPERKKIMKDNSRRLMKEKVCGSQQLVDYISKGNYISIDIRNGDSVSLENIMNLSFSKGSCV